MPEQSFVEPDRAPEDRVECHLRDELAGLRARRDELLGDDQQEVRAGDAADRAEAIGRVEDAERIDERIRQITHQLSTGHRDPAPPEEGAALPEGATITLRFSDGHEEVFYATSVPESAPPDAGIEVLGMDSPLAKALVGHRAGDPVSWTTPVGDQRADLLRLDPPLGSSGADSSAHRS